MGGIDYITSLPDSLRIRILSFLPTVDAVRTVCVPGFRYLWTSLPNLSFIHRTFRSDLESREYELEFRQEFIDFANNVLILHNRPTLDRFSFSMEFSSSELYTVLEGDKKINLRRVTNMISSWIHFALSKKVRILSLDFADCQNDMEADDPESDYHSLPSIVFRSRSLMELYLDRCCLNLFGGIQLESLRIRSLTRVGLTNPVLNQILSGCPVLEELSVRVCYDIDTLKISGTARLRKLHISVAFMEQLDISLSSIKFLEVFAEISEIICPNITHLEIDIQREDLMISDLPSLLEATVFLDKMSLRCTDLQLLKKFSNATSFKPSTFWIGYFLLSKFNNHPRSLFNWKHVTTVLGFQKWIIPAISRFLRSSPSLESLVIYFFPFHSAPNDTSEIIEDYYFDAENYWGSVDIQTFECLKHHLRNITIQGVITKPYVVDFIEFLLGNALVLEKMVISCKWPPKRYQNGYWCHDVVKENPVPSVSVVELLELVLGFRIASIRAAVHLS